MPRFAIALIPMFIIGLLVVFATYYTVDERERAVLTTNGRFTAVKGPGFYLKIPIIQSVTTYNVTQQSYSPKTRANIFTEDNQEVDAIFTVFYRITPQNVECIFKNYPDYKEQLAKIAEDRFKIVVGNINITDLARQRGKIRDATKSLVEVDAQRLLCLQVDDFQTTDFETSKEYRAGINASAVAKASVETAEQNKRQAEVIADTARIAALGTANAARETAKGRADATLFQAEAEAKGTVLKGEAEAKAIQALADAMAKNPQVVELRKAERWDGKLPTQMLGTAPIPLMEIR